MEGKEFFSGSGTLSKIAIEKGHYFTTLDNEQKFNPDVCKSILDEIDKQSYDFMWFSPPCKTFSVASIGTHWKGGHRAYEPKTKECELGISLLDKSIRIISKSKPKYWFIENPRGVMRKVIDKIFEKYGVKDYTRHTITYCQYGDTRMKPTDIWTNCKEWKSRPVCKNGMSCHTKAPRGAKTGTQGLKGSYERGILPKALCLEILDFVTK